MIDPQMQPILTRALANPSPAYEQIPTAKGRGMFEQLASYWNAPDVPLRQVSEVSVPGPAGGIPARLYVPGGASDHGPVLIYAHGGGWTFGSFRTHDRAVRLLAQDSGLRVLSIDYRLAPEHPFPAGHDDMLAAIRFVETGGLGVPVAASDIAVSGDSAGANIALGAMIGRTRAGLPQIGTAALFYGCFAPDFDTASHRDLGDGSFILSSNRMRWYWQNFLGADTFSTTSLAAPSRASLAELKTLPPLYLNAAGLDCLRDDTLIFATRLAQAGVGFRMDIIPGVVHGFMQMSAELPACRVAQKKAGVWLAEHFRKD